MSTRRRWARRAALLLAVALGAGACADDAVEVSGESVTTSIPPAPTSAPPTTGPPADADPGPDPAWPVPDWETIDPAAAGVDPGVLAELATEAETGGSDCLVVTRDGQLVGEWYWKGTGPDSEREAFSVTKSITSALVGIAQDQGHLDIDQPASDHIHEWVGTPSEPVTIRNLLSNDSGRFQTNESDYVQLATREADKTAYAIGLDQQHEIGTEWVYNNAAIQVLEDVLERATGTDVGSFAAEHLFGPLGMSTTITTDPAGNTLTFMGAQMSCRDMARFGLLFLRGGEWAGEQIVSADYVAEATSPSTALNPGYGLLWWLVGNDEEVDSERWGTVFSDTGAYAALGLGGQAIVVVPEHDLVVTRLGAPGGSFSMLGALSRIQGDLVVD